MSLTRASPFAPMPESFTPPVPCAQGGDARCEARPWRPTRPRCGRSVSEIYTSLQDAVGGVESPPAIPHSNQIQSQPRRTPDPIPPAQDRTRSAAAACPPPILLAESAHGRMMCGPLWPARREAGARATCGLRARVPCMSAPFATALCAWMLVRMVCSKGKVVRAFRVAHVTAHVSASFDARMTVWYCTIFSVVT